MSSYIPIDLQRRVREKFAQRCAYCQTAETLTVAIFEFDHIMPRAAGGQSIFENLCFVCPTCNRYKASRQTVVDPLSNETVSLFHPQRQQWSEHFAWSEDGTEIIGLTPTGRGTIAALKMNRPQLIRVRRMWVQMGEHPPSSDDS